MLSNKAALAAIGVVALVGASATGAFLASRRAEPAAAVSIESTASPTRRPRQVSKPPRRVVEDGRLRQPPHRPQRPCGRAAPAPAPAKPASRPDLQTPRRTEASRPSVPAAQAARDRSQPAAAAGASGSATRRTVRTAWLAAPVPTQERPVETVPRDRRARHAGGASTIGPGSVDTADAAAIRGRHGTGRRGHRTCSWSRACRATPRASRIVSKRASRATCVPNGRVAIPAGSRVLGSVSVVERGGKMRERARLGVRFHTVILADGTEVASADRNGAARGRVAWQRERGQGRRRRNRRRHPRRDSRRRQGRGHRRGRRRRRRHRGRDGRRAPSPHRFRPARR